MSRRGRARELAGTVVFTVCTALSVAASVSLGACGSTDVLIGIQNGAVSPSSSDDAGEGEASAHPISVTSADAAVSAVGPCQPDAGCPSGTMCEYPIDAGACALPGECFFAGTPSDSGSSPGVPVGTSGATSPLRPLLCEREGLGTRSARGDCPFTSAVPGFSLTRPSCDGGAEGDAEADATPPH